MVITFGNLLIWLLIAALIGFVGELIATPMATTTGVAAMCAGLAGTGR